MIFPRKALTFAAAAALWAGCARVGIPPGKPATEDEKPPKIEKVETVDANHLEVSFSEPMDETTLRDAENYAIVDEAGRPLAVEAAVVARPDAVTLVTAGQQRGAHYGLVTRNVKDASGGNAIEADNAGGFKGSKNKDDKEPAVATTYPADGALGVGLNPEVLVEFTDVMAADAAAMVKIYDDLGAPVPGHGWVEGYRLHYRVDAPLDYATKYAVVIKDAGTDLAGNVLYREQRFSFTTIDDAGEGVVTGKVKPLVEGVSPAGIEVRLTLAPDPREKAAKVVGYATADAEGNFVLGGVPPNSENEATYYLVASRDENGDGVPELVGGYGFADGKAAALPTFLGGERLENVEVVLVRADVEGPTVGKALLSPNPAAGQRSCYVRASLADAEGSNVAGAEIFFDEVWSDGTGVQLDPTAAEWGTSAAAEGEKVILDLGAYHATKRGRHKAFVHGRDAAGNWGEYAEVPFEVTGPPSLRRDVSGQAMFEKTPADKVLVTATPAGGAAPVAFGVTEKDGRYRLRDLAPGIYDVVGRLDEDGDGRWRAGEPTGVAPGVDVETADVAGVALTLTYAPAIAAANARLHNFAAGPTGEARAILTITATVKDRDLDLAKVAAVLPGGEEVELTDDGLPPDAAKGDGVYTYDRAYAGAEAAAAPEGEVTVYAEDGRGNRTTATAAAYPALRLVRLTPAALTFEAAADALTVSWTPVERAKGGYVVFVIPADRLPRFTEPGTGDVFSNYENPVFDAKLVVPFAAITDWWGYPARAPFVVMLAASAGDAAAFLPSDKAISSAEWLKPAPTAETGAGR